MARGLVRFENRATKAYIVAYNFSQFAAWIFIFHKLVESFMENGHFRSADAAVGGLVRKVQLIAFLEVLHACFGLVRSGPITALMQWAGRTHVVVAIIAPLPELQEHPAVFLTYAAWSFVEVIRYPQYGLTRLGICPKWLTWLRYTLFIVLYPAGVYGEMLVLYNALGPIRKKRLYARFFNKLQITYDTFIIGLLVVYPLLFLVLYKHMFKQRSVKLGRRRGGSRRTARD